MIRPALVLNSLMQFCMGLRFESGASGGETRIMIVLHSHAY